MPTKTVSLSDHAYDILREIPKGQHSLFVQEAILAVTINTPQRALHQCQMRLTEIEEGLQRCFPVAIGTKTKRNPKGDRRFSNDKFWVFLKEVYGEKDDPKWVEWWLS